MLRLPLALVVLGLTGSPLAQQPQPFPQNRLEFGNYWLSQREDLFPNYLRPGGNVAGDGLFKVFPAEVLERSGEHRISGYKITFSVDDSYTGSFPVQVQVPGVQFYRTVVRDFGGTPYETLDPTRPVGPAYPSTTLFLSTDNAWELEVRFSPGAGNPVLQQTLAVPPRPGGMREGIAMLVLAPPGQARSPSTAGTVMQSTFNERHVAPGRVAYSGSFDATTGQVAMFGQLGQPSARGELAVGLRFSTPTLQVFGDSAGGFADPSGFETFLGPGAYATDLASSGRSGFFGLLVQDQANHTPGQPPTHLALPFVVASSLQGPTADLQVGGVALRVAPGETALANLLVGAGFFGPLDTYRAGGPAGHDHDLQGVYQTGRIPLQLDPSFLGTVLWFQTLITGRSLTPVTTTNAVRMTVQ